MPVEIINGLKINYQSNERVVIPEVYFEDPYRVGEIKQGGIVIDIGVCIGVFSIRCASERGCIVYAYEPYEQSYKLAVENIKINNLESKIKIFNKAVTGDIYNIRDFYILPNHFAGSTFYPGEGIPYTKVKVECTTLNDILKDNNLDRCDMVKIDCEGEEKHILKETDVDTLEKIDKIVLEYHCYADGKEIMEYLRKMGFAVYSEIGAELPQVERSELYAIR